MGSVASWIFDPSGLWGLNKDSIIQYGGNDDSSPVATTTTASTTDSTADATAKAKAASKKRISETTSTVKTTPLGQYGGSGSVTTQKKSVLGV